MRTNWKIRIRQDFRRVFVVTAGLFRSLRMLTKCELITTKKSKNWTKFQHHLSVKYLYKSMIDIMILSNSLIQWFWLKTRLFTFSFPYRSVKQKVGSEKVARLFRSTFWRPYRSVLKGGCIFRYLAYYIWPYLTTYFTPAMTKSQWGSGQFAVKGQGLPDQYFISSNEIRSPKAPRQTLLTMRQQFASSHTTSQECRLSYFYW